MGVAHRMNVVVAWAIKNGEDSPPTLKGNVPPLAVADDGVLGVGVEIEGILHVFVQGDRCPKLGIQSVSGVEDYVHVGCCYHWFS